MSNVNFSSSKLTCILIIPDPLQYECRPHDFTSMEVSREEFTELFVTLNTRGLCVLMSCVCFRTNWREIVSVVEKNSERVVVVYRTVPDENDALR